MIKNQIPLTFNKTYCIRTGKSWYEPKGYVLTTEEQIRDFRDKPIDLENIHDYILRILEEKP